MEERGRIKENHALVCNDRKKLSVIGVTEVVSFDLSKVVLKTQAGLMTVKGNELHVNQLSLEKSELGVDGRIDSIEYSHDKSVKAKEGFMKRLMA